MESITELYDWLSSLKILQLNIWASIYPTGPVWSTCSRVDVASWWRRGQYKYTAILRGCERQYVKLTLFSSVYFTYYSGNMITFNRIGWKSVHRGTTSLSGCTSSSQYLYGDTAGYSWLHQYPSSGFRVWWIWKPRSVIYWSFTYIKEWCQIKSKIPASRGGVSYRDRKIKCLQAMAC